MKKLPIILSVLAIVLLTGCSSAYDGTDTAMQDDKINSDFELIDGYDNLYYCKDTKIVYWIGGSYQVNTLGNDYTTSYMTVYYAPNGLPYIYDNNKLKEIQ